LLPAPTRGICSLIRREKLSSPAQTSQCKSYKVVLNALNSRWMNHLMRRPHTRGILQTWTDKSSDKSHIQRLVRVRVTELPWNSLYKSQHSSWFQHNRLNMWLTKVILLSTSTPRSLITSTRSRSLSPMTYWNITGLDPRENEMDLHFAAFKSYLFFY
jgi:hypothetical protein